MATSLNPKDIEVLNIMWGAKDSILASDIVANKENPGGAALSTVGAVIRKLLANGLIDIDGISFLNRVPARKYRPLPKSKEEVTEHMLDEIDKVRNIVSLEELLVAQKRRDQQKNR